MLLSDIPHDSARKRPNHPALITGGHEYSYADLSNRVNAVAGAVAGRVCAGDRVAILADNCVEYIDCLYGVPQAGATLTLVNQRLAAPEVESILEDAKPRILIIGANHLERLGDMGARLGFLDQVVVIGYAADGTITYDELVADGAANAPHARPQDNAIAWLIYTSGTTGKPKGVMLSHRNIVSSMLNAMLEWNVTRDERKLFCFPLCHVAAFVALVYHLRECTIVLTPGFDPGAFLTLVEEHKITQTGLAPVMLNMILAQPDIDTRDTSSLKLIVYGASSITPTLLERGIARFGDVFLQTFGQTELAGNVLFLGVKEHQRAAQGEPHLLAAAGRCESLAIVKLVDDDGDDVPANEIGEIVVRGDQVMQGYWGNEQATSETIIDGWLHTGDLARRDEEGLFYIVDRKKDMVISGGENVYPKEVEDVIAAIDGIADVAVFGLPDDQWGEAVTAVVVAAPDATVDPGAVIDACREKLASYKVPKRVELRDELPRNASMKVLKRVLRAELQAAPAS